MFVVKKLFLNGAHHSCVAFPVDLLHTHTTHFSIGVQSKRHGVGKTNAAPLCRTPIYNRHFPRFSHPRWLSMESRAGGGKSRLARAIDFPGASAALHFLFSISGVRALLGWGPADLAPLRGVDVNATSCRFIHNSGGWSFGTAPNRLFSSWVWVAEARLLRWVVGREYENRTVDLLLFPEKF